MLLTIRLLHWEKMKDATLILLELNNDITLTGYTFF